MIFKTPKYIDQPTNKLSYSASKGLNFQSQLFVASKGRSFLAYVSLSFRGRNFRVLPPKTSKKNNQNFFDSSAISWNFIQYEKFSIVKVSSRYLGTLTKFEPHNFYVSNLKCSPWKRSIKLSLQSYKLSLQGVSHMISKPDVNECWKPRTAILC